MEGLPKILLVSPKPPPHHGATRAVEILLEGCADEVEWRHVDARYSADVGDLQSVKIGKFFSLFKYLCQTAVGCLRCDGVVLTPSFQAGTFLKDSLFVWLCWALSGKKPVVAWYHMRFRTMRYEERSALFRWFARATMRRITHHACVAESLVAELPDFIDNGHAEALPNGIPPFEGKSGSGGDGPLKVLYLSHMGEAKGWRVLLEAAEALCAERDDLEFLFYGPPGPGDDVASLENEFAQVSAPDSIRYMGFADDAKKQELFKTVDILCFPSLNEAFPITILEAMSAGLPIVASEVGGIPDAIVDGEGGAVVPPGEAAPIRDAIAKLASEPELRKRFGDFNQRRYRERFTEEAFCERWSELLNRATGRR